jgi:hypothetical protein
MHVKIITTEKILILESYFEDVWKVVDVEINVLKRLKFQYRLTDKHDLLKAAKDQI